MALFAQSTRRGTKEKNCQNPEAPLPIGNATIEQLCAGKRCTQQMQIKYRKDQPPTGGSDPASTPESIC
jgi:hypothetical protein